MVTKYIELSPDTLFLLVDDAQSVRDTLGMALRSMGLRSILQCSDASGALESLKTNDVQFIICDRYLRRVSGMELLKEIREDTALRHVPFVMMAGEVTKDDVLLASEFGIDGYLQKPFAIKEVAQKVTACLSRYQDPNNPEKSFESARLHLSKGHYKTALEEFSALLARFPDSARAHVGMARAFNGLDNAAEAALELQQAISKNPLYVHAHHELGVLLLRNEDLEGALAAFDAAIQASPLNPIRYEAIADILMREKKFERAEEYLKRAIKLELVYPNIFCQLGKALFAQKKMEKAIKYFEQALLGQPNSPSFLNSLGICFKEIGKHDEALKHYNLALKSSQADTKILFNKALCLIQMQDLDRARKTLQQILALDPTYTKAQEKLDLIDQVHAVTRAV